MEPRSRLRSLPWTSACYGPFFSPIRRSGVADAGAQIPSAKRPANVHDSERLGIPEPSKSQAAQAEETDELTENRRSWRRASSQARSVDGRKRGRTVDLERGYVVGAMRLADRSGVRAGSLEAARLVSPLLEGDWDSVATGGDCRRDAERL